MKRIAVRLLALTMLTLGLVSIAAPAQAATAPVVEPPLTVIFMGGPPSVEHRTAFMAALADCNPQLVCTWLNPGYSGSRYDYAIGWVPAGPGCREIGAPFDNAISSIYNRINYDTTWYFQHGCMYNAIGNFDVLYNTAVDFGTGYWGNKFSSFNRCGIAWFNC